MNRLEASETQLQLQVDDLTDKIEELEEQIKNMKLMEKQLRAALVKTENNELELNVQLENVQRDVEVSKQIVWTFPFNDHLKLYHSMTDHRTAVLDVL